jgi:hypothetical protein
MDPYLDSIRQDPRFALMAAELQHNLDQMRESLMQAEKAEDLESLRARVRKT